MKPPLSWDIPIIIGLFSFSTLVVSLLTLQQACSDREQDTKIAVIQTVTAQQHPPKERAR